MLSSKWFRGGLTKEEKDKLTQTIKGSSFVLNILTEILEQELRTLEATKSEDYDNPNWALKAADKNGQIRQIKNVLTLVKLERNTNA